MQFILNFSLKNNVTLSISHHQQLQGLIYKILENQPEYSQALHDYGYKFNGHNYKLFTFGLIKGHYAISNKKITFKDKISFEVRSPMPDFCDAFKSSIFEGMNLQLNNQPFVLTSYDINDTFINTSKIKIRMNSPVTVHTTLDNNKTYYYNPLDLEFSDEINNNFIRKCSAAIQSECNDSISIKVLQIGSKDKYVTKFKNNILITAWKGTFELSGPEHALNFLYNSGIGSNNSQGFGMFDIIK